MTVSITLIAHQDKMTPSERQLLKTLLDDYPIAGLSSITELANTAGVSTTTVVRLLKKTGYEGFPQFQSALRDELKEMISNPIAKRDIWRNDLPKEHILKCYSRQALDNQQCSLDDVNPDAFDQMCQLLSDPKRRIYITGGRITRTIAHNLYLHLQMIRPHVRMVSSGGSWPHDFLDVEPNDVVVVFDVRRYENSTLQLAQMCHDKGAEVVLFTDLWRSPIDRIAKHTFASHIVVPSAWDSCLPTLMLTECTIAAVQKILWETVKDRTEALEIAFDQSKLFRKFT